MTPVELLQQVGLNKYEAEAYHALLASGPLTGYELGKRSEVPLSRSYEILERLLQKGLAVVQPGDPPRYDAEAPERFLGRVRATLTTTLDALTDALAQQAHPSVAGEFWVLRGRAPILARVHALLAEAQHAIDLNLPTTFRDGAESMLTQAQKRGCRVRRGSDLPQSLQSSDVILLLIDERIALAGALSPAERCQALCSEHPALVALVQRFFSSDLAETQLSAAASAKQPQADWVAWETRKQQQLLRLATGGRVA